MTINTNVGLLLVYTVRLGWGRRGDEYNCGVNSWYLCCENASRGGCTAEKSGKKGYK